MASFAGTASCATSAASLMSSSLVAFGGMLDSSVDSETVPYDRRALRLHQVRDLLYRRSLQFLPLDEHLVIRSAVMTTSDRWVILDNGSRMLEVTTKECHGLHRYDRVSLEGGTSSQSSFRRTMARINSWYNFQADEMYVSRVINQHTVQVVLTGTFDALGFSHISVPLNMHKLAPEVVIPLTTVKEIVVCLSTTENLELFVDGLEGHQNLSLKENLRLPEVGYLEEGLTLHGRLSARGHVRRRYWDLGIDRGTVWLTRSGMDGVREVDPVPQSFAEDEPFATVQDLVERFQQEGCCWVVLRKGVSYAEVVHDGLAVNDFISHSWCESSSEFYATLSTARVSAAWICTLAVCQHNVPDLSGNWRDSPFYQALASLTQSGRVVMLLDDQASVLTRIWPVFEVWVTTRLKLRFQMFLHSGELNFHSDALGARMARDKIEKLDLEAAKSSVEADKTMILNVINNEGGMPVVLWQVKRTLSVSALLFLLCLVSDTSAFVFASPWIIGLSEMWFRHRLHARHSVGYSRVLFLCAAVWHLRHWYRVFCRADLKSTLRGFRATLSMGTGFVRCLALISCFDIILGVVIFVTVPSFTNLVAWVLCSEKPLWFCCVTTVYTLQKTLPWVVGKLAVSCFSLNTNIREFEPAVPPIGYLITVTACCALTWQQLEGGHMCFASPACNSDGGTTEKLTHLKLDEPTRTHHVILFGLSAWFASVSWSCLCEVRKFSQMSTWRWWLVNIMCFLLLFAMVLRLHEVFLTEDWFHLQGGVLIWALGSMMWHRHYIAKTCCYRCRRKLSCRHYCCCMKPKRWPDGVELTQLKGQDRRHFHAIEKVRERPQSNAPGSGV